eukprot:564222_1
MSACLVLVLLCFISSYGTSIDLTLSVATNTTKRTIPEPFIGFNLDYWKNNTESFGTSSIPYIDFSNRDLITLTSALSPAILRIGGSPSDSVIYNISGECNDATKSNLAPQSYYCSEVKPPNYFCMNTSRWKEIFEFISATNLELVYGLNACYGRQATDQMMNISNIDALLRYTASTVSTVFNISKIRGFEFGNGMASSIAPEIYSYDFIRLHTLIQRYFINDTNTMPITIGTDNYYGDTKYVQQVLSKLPNATMRALNYHQYINCEVGNPDVNESVFDMECLDKINEYPPMYENVLLNMTHQANTTLWVGESALHSHGGKKGETNVFVSSLYYIYQLCELAQYAYMDVVLRQTLSGGNYELINGTNNLFAPNPDYYVLWMWRQFIGDRMLGSSFIDGNKYVTAYAFNGRIQGEVVIVMINFSYNVSATVHIKFQSTNDEYQCDEYHMNGPLNSSVAYVNGDPLLYKNGKLPQLKKQTGNGKVELASTTAVWIGCSTGRVI